MKLGFREYTRNHPHTLPIDRYGVRTKAGKKQSSEDAVVKKMHILQELEFDGTMNLP
ncbi:hypothetical protein HanXRQr2_Chr13g0615621 [Helianthus annuus]|uniref:Uncharacterized protein n=1 Tax=Helianthus annuus TaxID=4232 RepID=A0A9K3EL74_HELAN|nr:hypothetical protein HanXRQr2_Chr13g0615621 [Helianthus annuus]